MFSVLSLLTSVSVAHAMDLVPVFTKAAAQPLSAIGGEPSSFSSSVVDFSPTILAASHLLLVALAAVVSYWAQSHIRDQSDRQNFDALINQGVNLGLAKEASALKGHPLSADVGSAVAAHAFAFAQEQEPGMIKRLGLDDTDVAKRAVAALPAVDGPVHEDTVKAIVGAANGVTQAPPNYADLVSMLERGLQQATEAVIARQYTRDAPTPVKPPSKPLIADPPQPV